jgi:hypothetical protein
MGATKDIVDIVLVLRKIRKEKATAQREKERADGLLRLLNLLEDLCTERPTSQGDSLAILRRFAAIAKKHSLRQQLGPNKSQYGDAFRELEVEAQYEGIEVGDASEDEVST